MRKTSISMILLALLGAGACTREIAQDSPEQQGDIVLRIALDGLETKTAGEGAENTVSTLDIVIFNNAGTQQLYNWHVDNASTTISGGYYVHSTTVGAMSNLGSDKSATLQSAKVFAVANYPGGAISASATLAEVKAAALSADNASDSPAAGKFVYLKDGRYHLLSTPSFVMTAEGGFTKDGEKVVSTLTLERLAAKVSLTLNYAATPILTDGHDDMLNVDTKTVWTPLTDEDLRIYLDNAVMEATLGGPKASPAHFTYADNHPTGDPLASAAFYTYPATWTEGSGDAPFVKIIQPWHYQTLYNSGTESAPVPVVIDENVVELYYKVMFPGLTALESNTWYQPTVTLNVLGGEADRPKELIPTGLDVLPWGDASSEISDIDVQPVKYLTVDRENTTVTNGNGVQVRYFASGPATLTVSQIFKVTYRDADSVIRKIYPADGTVADALAGDSTVPAGTTDPNWWFSNTYDPSTHEGIVQLNHTLSSDITADPRPDNFAARPYTYSLTLSLDGGGVPDQSFTIIQNPSIFVKGHISSGFVSVDNQTSALAGIYRKRTTSTDNPIADGATTSIQNNGVPSNYYINMLYKTGGSSGPYRQTSLGRVHTYRYLDGENICQYNISIFPSPHNGIFIMDPRVSLGDDAVLESIVKYHKEGWANNGETDKANFNKTGTPLVNSSNTTDNEKIEKYKPASREKNLVAPAFMVASSYGKSSNIRYENAVLRCLAYQEDGYPAGRWRLPTEAEIEYCVKLQNANAIPTLFNETSGYIASSGRVYKSGGFSDYANFTGTADGDYQAYPRCVYDIWYWGREEETSLRTSDFGTDYTKPQYTWSGWDYITKK